MPVGYEVTNDKGERGWWDGKKVTPLDANGLQIGKGAGGGIMRDTKTDQEDLARIRAEATQALDTARQSEQFTKLNEKVPTGRGWNVPLLGLDIPLVNEPTWGGVMETFSPKAQQMKSIASRLAPRQRVPGSGASTDTDVKIFFDALPSLSNMGSANGEVTRDITNISTRKSAESAFKEAYFQRNGSLLGAEGAFKEWYARNGSKYDVDNFKPGAKKPPPLPGQPGAMPPVPQRGAGAGVFQGKHGTVRLVK